MSNLAISILFEKLLEYCLAKRAMIWNPSPIARQAMSTSAICTETMGGAVIYVSYVFQTRVLEHSESILDLVLQEDYPLYEQYLLHIITIVSLRIFDSGNAAENTYIFLAVMVFVSFQCIVNRKGNLIPIFGSLIPGILNSRLLNGFIPNLPYILNYARHHPEPR